METLNVVDEAGPSGTNSKVTNSVNSSDKFEKCAQVLSLLTVGCDKILATIFLPDRIWQLNLTEELVPQARILRSN